MTSHDDVDLDPGQGTVVESISDQRAGDEACRRSEARGVIVENEIVVDGLRDVEGSQGMASSGCDFRDDATGVGAIVASNVEEKANVPTGQLLEDLLAILFVWLVSTRAQGRPGSGSDRLESRFSDS